MKDMLTLGIGLMAGFLLSIGLAANTRIEAQHWQGMTIGQMLLENARIAALERMQPDQ